MNSWLKNHAKGSLLRLYIQPGASKTTLSGVHGERLKVKIKALPTDGEANKELEDYFSEILQVPKSKIFLVRGEVSRQKDILVELSPDRVFILVEELLK